MTENDFDEIVKKNNQRVFLIALSFTKNNHDAEDIMQNVFLKLWRSRGNFSDEEHITKWLTVVTANESKNLLKLCARKNTQSIQELADDIPFEEGEDRDIFSAVMALPPKLSLVIHLFYYEDMSIKDIAKTLKIRESAVKTRLNRGRSKLKEMLGGTWADEEKI